MINNQLIEISCKFLLTNDLYMINSSHGRVIKKPKPQLQKIDARCKGVSKKKEKGN